MEKLESVGKKVVEVLIEAGYGKIETLARVNPDVLAELKGIGKKKAAQIVEEAKNILSAKAPQVKPEGDAPAQ